MNTSTENRFASIDEGNMSNTSALGEVILNCANFVLYSFGTFIHLKIISTCIKEKDKTWQIDVTHSVGMIILFFFTIMFEMLTNYFPGFREYTGTWICYVAAFIYTSGALLMLFHSLVVAFTKYIFIVHQKRVLKFGEEKTRSIFFWINIFHPLFLTIPKVYFLDFESFLSIISCLGLKEQLDQINSASTGRMGRMFMCKLNIDVKQMSNSPISYNVQQGFCAATMIWVLLLSCNIPEAYCYFTIFKKMRR